jgi:hypothetical protein
MPVKHGKESSEEGGFVDRIRLIFSDQRYVILLQAIIILLFAFYPIVTDDLTAYAQEGDWILQGRLLDAVHRVTYPFPTFMIFATLFLYFNYNYFAWKLTFAVFAVGTLIMLPKITRQLGISDKTLWFTFSPVALLTIANGFFDPIPLFLSTVGVYYFLKGDDTKAYLFMALCASVKWFGLVIMLFLIVYSLKNKRPILPIILGIGVFAILNLPLLIVTGGDLSTIYLTFYQFEYESSLGPYQVVQAIIVLLGLPFSHSYFDVSMFFVAAFLAYVLVLTWRGNTSQRKTVFLAFALGLMGTLLLGKYVTPRFILWELPLLICVVHSRIRLGAWNLTILAWYITWMYLPLSVIRTAIQTACAGVRTILEITFILDLHKDLRSALAEPK